jgi:hypothetical protein
VCLYSFLCGRKRSQSAGSGKFEKKFSKDDIYRREDEGEGEGDGGGSDSARKSSSGSEARLAQYEKPLTKGHKTTLREKREKDPEKIAKRKTEKRERSQVERERERESMLRVRYSLCLRFQQEIPLCTLHKQRWLILTLRKIYNKLRMFFSFIIW